MNTGAELYLDTARLGRMKKSAQWAVRDFARLAGEVALTLYGTNLLVHGFEALSEHQRRQCPRLQTWGGIEQFKRNLLACVDAEPDQECLLSSRSLAIIRLGARLMARRCRRVLVPDLLWCPYASVIRAIVQESGGRVEHLNLRREVFTARESGEQIMERIVSCFAATRCDAACLPTVTHDGVRLPLDRIIERLRNAAPASFVMVDAAQGLGHIPSELGVSAADLTVAGVHKWLGAGMPLGIGMGRRKILEELWQINDDDPLLKLTGPNGLASATETANLWPLVACNAVVSESTYLRQRTTGTFATRLANRRAVLQVVRGRGWTPLLPHPSLRSGILLLRQDAESRQRSARNPEAVRTHFQSYGIALSSYPEALIRLSLPAKRMRDADLARFAAAL